MKEEIKMIYAWHLVTETLDYVAIVSKIAGLVGWRKAHDQMYEMMADWKP